jgi:hypothetical protein
MSEACVFAYRTLHKRYWQLLLCLSTSKSVIAKPQQGGPLAGAYCVSQHDNADRIRRKAIACCSRENKHRCTRRCLKEPGSIS